MKPDKKDETTYINPKDLLPIFKRGVWIREKKIENIIIIWNKLKEYSLRIKTKMTIKVCWNRISNDFENKYL